MLGCYLAAYLVFSNTTNCFICLKKKLVNCFILLIQRGKEKAGRFVELIPMNSWSLSHTPNQVERSKRNNCKLTRCISSSSPTNHMIKNQILRQFQKKLLSNFKIIIMHSCMSYYSCQSYNTEQLAHWIHRKHIVINPLNSLSFTDFKGFIRKKNVISNI